MHELIFAIRKPFSNARVALISFFLAFFGFLSFGAGFVIVTGFVVEAARVYFQNEKFSIPSWDIQKTPKYFMQGLKVFFIVLAYSMLGLLVLAISAVKLFMIVFSSGFQPQELLSDIFPIGLIGLAGIALTFLGWAVSVVAVINFIQKQRLAAAFDLKTVLNKTLSLNFLFFLAFAFVYFLIIVFALGFLGVASFGVLFLLLAPGAFFYAFQFSIIVAMEHLTKQKLMSLPDFGLNFKPLAKNFFQKTKNPLNSHDLSAATMPKNKNEPEENFFKGNAFDSSTIVFRGNRTQKTDPHEVLQSRISSLDSLIHKKGFERSSTILVSGGAGTGKTTFALQAIHNGALNGLKGIYLSFEEQPEKIKLHMKESFGWDFEELEKKGLVSIIKVNPAEISRSLEESMLQKEGGLMINLKKIEFPFYPDLICVDSLSALSIAFEKEETYRRYIRELFEALEQSHAVSFVLSETEQNPRIYSRTGVEEFLADGVIVLYNLSKKEKRVNALEILKLRGSQHKKGLVYYKITPDGIQLEA